MSSAASVIASFAAATAYWQNNSIRLAAFASIYCFASKSLTSAARWHLYPSVSNFVISPKPIFPSFTDCQNSSTLSPIGVIAPIPVTTTRLLITFPFHSSSPKFRLFLFDPTQYHAVKMFLLLICSYRRPRKLPVL